MKDWTEHNLKLWALNCWGVCVLFISFGLQYKGPIEKSVMSKSPTFKSVVLSTLHSIGKRMEYWFLKKSYIRKWNSLKKVGWGTSLAMLHEVHSDLLCFWMPLTPQIYHSLIGMLFCQSSKRKHFFLFKTFSAFQAKQLM